MLCWFNDLNIIFLKYIWLKSFIQECIKRKERVITCSVCALTLFSHTHREWTEGNLGTDVKNAPSWCFRIQQLMTYTLTSYSLLLMHKDVIYAVRDPFGNRPLCVGKLINAPTSSGQFIPSMLTVLHSLSHRLTPQNGVQSFRFFFYQM